MAQTKITFLILLLMLVSLSSQQPTTTETTTTTTTTASDDTTTTESTTTPRRQSTEETTTTTEATTTTRKPSPNNGKGHVAFIAGNIRTSDEVEIYSPEGKCQYNLAPLPLAILPSPILFMLEDKIIACADTIYAYFEGDSQCWFYTADNDKWSRFDTNKTWEQFKRFGKPGILYDDVLFIVDDYKPEAFDPATTAWTHWPKPINATSVGGCLVRWGTTLILFGGLQNERAVQQYDVESHNWKLLAPPPMDIEHSGCTVLPNKKVLILGSTSAVYRREAAMYDPETNTWESLGGTKYDRFGTSLLTLGERVFAIGGGFDPDVKVEEYDYNEDTWHPVEPRTKLHRMKHTTMAVPARFFANKAEGCEGV